MKIFNIDWRRFFDALPVWSSTERTVREAFLTGLKPSGSALNEQVGEMLPVLLECGLVERTGAAGDRVQTAERFRPFLRAARAMHRVRILESPTLKTLRRYAMEHWSHRELRELAAPPSHSMDPYHTIGYFRRGRWLDEFLRSEPTQGQVHGSAPGEPPEPGDPQRLVEAILEYGGPVALVQLVEIAPRLGIDRIARAIYSPLAAGVLFASLDSEYTPRIGLWPEIVERRFRPRVELPEKVRVDESFGLALLVEDVATFLRGCASRAPRLKAHCMDLYVRDLREIAGKLVAAPRWLPEALSPAVEDRARRAQRTASRLELTTLGFEGATGPPHCHCSDLGRQWLSGGQEERLRMLVAPVRQSLEERAWITVGDSTFTTEIAATVEALGALEPLAFLPLNEFLTFHALQENPLAGARSIRRGWVEHTQLSDSEVEDLWRQELLRTLTEVLAPFGGVRWGRAGSTACFAITEVGRYILGLADSFILDPDNAAQVVVQPNLEIVFLSPSPHSAALLAPVAERRGSEEIGTLFEITRSSILDAAASGMEVKEIVRLLEDASTHELPPNVRQQIESWCGQLRRVRQRTLTVIECPDRQTARRVGEVLGSSASPLTDTFVELKREALTQSQRNKLAEAGISMEKPRLGE